MIWLVSNQRKDSGRVKAKAAARMIHTGKRRVRLPATTPSWTSKEGDGTPPAAPLEEDWHAVRGYKGGVNHNGRQGAVTGAGMRRWAET